MALQESVTLLPCKPAAGSDGELSAPAHPVSSWSRATCCVCCLGTLCGRVTCCAQQGPCTCPTTDKVPRCAELGWTSLTQGWSRGTQRGAVGTQQQVQVVAALLGGHHLITPPWHQCSTEEVLELRGRSGHSPAGDTHSHLGLVAGSH